MEGKKLNLNQPFLSVRRHSSSQGVTTSVKDDERRRHTPLIPYYKSELKSGPVGKNGAVPFHWEQTPGKPREEIRTVFDENKDQTTVDNRQVQSETKLPPGRYHKPIVKDSHQVCLSNFENNVKNSCNNDNFESVKEKHEEKSSPNTEDDGNKIYDDDDADEMYEDALDTLSRSNSTFLNCSLSGVSGLEDLDVKPCRNFSRDPKTLDLVMDRFLPAAKAMVSETPQYIPKKPIVNREQSQEVKKIATKIEDKPVLRYGPSFANRYLNYYHVSEEAEEDEEENSDDDRGHGALIPPVCGLLPRFCSRGSSGILNPGPGLKLKTRLLKSRGNQVRSKSSSHCPNTMTRNDFKYDSCNMVLVNKTRTVEIEENEATTGCESRERVLKTFGEFLDDKETPGQELDSRGGDVAEENIRIDTIQAIESQPVVLGLQDEDHDTKADPEPVVHFPLEDLKNLYLVEGGNKSSTAADDTEIDLKESEICNKRYSEFIISPPLPKSPSDSWLWRTLPSVSAKNMHHRHSNIVAEKLNQKVSIGVSRWEAIVKFSKLQHDNSH